MPSPERAARRDKKRESKRKMGISGRGLLNEIDWEARLAKQQKKKRKRV
jgi:hypothetical protein